MCNNILISVTQIKNVSVIFIITRQYSASEIGGARMFGIIVCQECEEVLEYIESEKVHVLYAKCTGCHTKKETEEVCN